MNSEVRQCIDDDHAGDDQREPDDGRQVKPLPEDEDASQGDDDDAQA